MFEVIVSQAKVFKNIIDSIRDIVTQANIVCSEEGLFLQSLDASHVAMVSLELKADGFEKYRCDKNFVMGVDLSILWKIFGSMDPLYSLQIIADERSSEAIFKFIAPKEDREYEFTVKLLNIEQETMTIPEIEYVAVVTLSSREYKLTTDRFNNYNPDIIEIIVSDTSMEFLSKGGDMDAKETFHVPPNTNKSKEKNDDQIQVELNNKNEKIHMGLALKHLKYFAKAAPLSNKVVLSMNPEYPLTLRFDIPEMGNLKFYLAPKIDDEDNSEKSSEQGKKRKEPHPVSDDNNNNDEN